MTKHDTITRFMEPRLTNGATRDFVFFLTPSFSPMSVCTAIETLAKANESGASPKYSWTTVSPSGQAMTSKSGITLAVDCSLQECSYHSTIFICGGERIDETADKDTRTWLRKAARHGARFGALNGGVGLLAQIGLTSGRKVASHWTTAMALQEVYPETEVTQSIFEISDKLISCAGDAATLDLFLNLVADQDDEDCAQLAAASLACSNIRDRHNEQTMTLSCRFGSQNRHMTQAIEIMRSNMETPVSPPQVAQAIGISTRQLERLFAKNMKMSPKVYINKVRLEHARILLQQTRLSIVEVALATGFQNTSHFSKLYRSRFGTTPTSERGLLSTG